MTDITPPPELVQQWAADKTDYFTDMIRAAQWGADQELEACCQWVSEITPAAADDLRSDRRPKPPSLKEQALDALASLQRLTTDPNIIEPLRRALEALPE